MDSSKTPSWGAPASGISQNSQQSPQKNNPYFQSGQPQNFNRHQRQSPYQNNAGRGRNGSPNNFQERGDNDTVVKSFQNFSSSNPFNDLGKKFSNENPFQKNISPGTDNSFQNRSQYSSPNFQQRPRFQSSPIHQSGFPPRFSPHTPSKNFNTPSRRFQTPSSAGYSNDSASQHFNSSKKPYFQRNKSLNNPGGSDNIQEYIHPSMLEDPWKDLPATPMLQSY
ncbi:unnamed protein product [Lymnaea stagnalis]|uniref:Uncharacterized protein n=1 Tax=Lymnaea stagnalis TaxID=6523 RepID=A0AAV2HNA3_LYMST